TPKIRVIAATDPTARLAVAAGETLLRLLAQQRGRRRQGETAFTDAGKSMNEPSVREAIPAAQPFDGRRLLPWKKTGSLGHQATCAWRDAASMREMRRSTRSMGSAVTAVISRSASSTLKRWGSRAA